ncbi:MAG: alpha/beta hydrolase [Pseudomonadota bacterium]
MTLIGPASNSYYSQRHRLHYVDWGNPDAPPLILLHGGRDHCRNWDWTAQVFRDRFHIIAPDLRGHGDSQWASDGNYPMLAYIYDLKQLIDQLDLAPVTIVAHSLGGNIATRYTGLYPDTVKKLVAIEGLGPSPKVQQEMAEKGFNNRLRGWLETKQKYADVAPRRYKDFAAALERMQQENPHLSEEQVRHLTVHAVIRNEDGSYSWKFDPLMRNWWPHDLPNAATEEMWRAITCPTLMLYGADSWASNPEKDGRITYFGDNVAVREFQKAGHWLHHDQFALFRETLEGFL